MFDLVQGQRELERTSKNLIGATIKKSRKLEHRMLNLVAHDCLQGQRVVQVDPERPSLELIVRNLELCGLEIGFVGACPNFGQPSFARGDSCRFGV